MRRERTTNKIVCFKCVGAENTSKKKKWFCNNCKKSKQRTIKIGDISKQQKVNQMVIKENNHQQVAMNHH